jgi:hypothetical protein
MKLRWNPIRDIAGGALGAMFGLGGLAGAAAKKFLIDKNDGFGKRFAVGLATTVFTLGTGLVPFLVTSPGRDAQADMMEARQGVAQNRYGANW